MSSNAGASVLEVSTSTAEATTCLAACQGVWRLTLICLEVAAVSGANGKTSLSSHHPFLYICNRVHIPEVQYVSLRETL